MFELKPISRTAIPAALEKAHRYRLLDEAQEAESICRDVLEVDPGNQEAAVTLLLALTDQFEERLHPCLEEAQQALSLLGDDYGRSYYGGIIRERQAKAHLRRGGPRAGHGAYELFRQAMELYDRAAPLRPPGNDDAVLRWNACARILMSHPELAPEPEERFEPWLE